ncbi:MAG: DUF4167 domain-containing protein [Proteobacteria bacterium]|nr:DUF4167 domain-containing protein [Pseudomonadota bacterium]
MKNGIIKKNRHRINRPNRPNQNNNGHVDSAYSSENDSDERLDYRPARNRIMLQQNIDKYLNLARDAASSGDRVQAENYLQHADHFNRLLNEQKEIKQQFDQKKQQSAMHHHHHHQATQKVENQDVAEKKDDEEPQQENATVPEQQESLTGEQQAPLKQKPRPQRQRQKAVPSQVISEEVSE